MEMDSDAVRECSSRPVCHRCSSSLQDLQAISQREDLHTQTDKSQSWLLCLWVWGWMEFVLLLQDKCRPRARWILFSGPKTENPDTHTDWRRPPLFSFIKLWLPPFLSRYQTLCFWLVTISKRSSRLFSSVPLIVSYPATWLSTHPDKKTNIVTPILVMSSTIGLRLQDLFLSFTQQRRADAMSPDSYFSSSLLLIRGPQWNKQNT